MRLSDPRTIGRCIGMVGVASFLAGAALHAQDTTRTRQDTARTRQDTMPTRQDTTRGRQGRGQSGRDTSSASQQRSMQHDATQHDATQHDATQHDAMQHGNAGQNASRQNAGQQGGAQRGSRRVSAADRSFLLRAARMNAFEIEAGRLAQDSARSDTIQTYARQMVDDHTALGQQLRDSVAGLDESLTLSDSADANARARLNTLRRSKRFDATYRQQMITSHQETLALFQSYAKRKNANPSIRAVIRSAVPNVQMHLSAARRLPSTRTASR